MTIYDARAAGRWLRWRVRPTLRLRLTLVSGALVVAGSLLLLLVAYVLVRKALDDKVPADQPVHDTLVSGIGFNLLLYGLLAVVVISAIAIGCAYAVAGQSLRPLQQVTSTARHLTGDT